MKEECKVSMCLKNVSFSELTGIIEMSSYLTEVGKHIVNSILLGNNAVVTRRFFLSKILKPSNWIIYCRASQNIAHIAKIQCIEKKHFL